MTRKLTRFCAVALGAGLLAGCATTNETVTQQSDHYKATNAQLEAARKQREAANESAQASMARPKVVDWPYVDTTPVTVEEGLSKDLDKHITLNQPRPAGIDLVMDKLSQSLGVDVRFESDIVDPGQGTEDSGSDEATAPMTIPGEDSAGNASSARGRAAQSLSQAISLPGLSGPQSAVGQDVSDMPEISVSTSGPADDVLDTVAHAMNASWRYDETSRSVVFYRYLTRTLELSVLPGAVANSVSMDTLSGSNGGEGGGAGESGAETELEYGAEMDTWETVAESVRTMLSSKGDFAISESAGQLTVRDYPDVVKRVERYIEKVNKTFSRQVSARVRVLKVQHNNGDSRGINWNTVFQSSQFRGSIVSSALRPDADGTDGSLAELVLGATDEGSPWNGSEILIDSLSEIGEVSEVTSVNVQTVHNQPVPVRVTESVAYLRSVQQTSTTDVGTSTSLEPGTVETGFKLQLLPSVKQNGRDMLMQVMISLSTLDDINTFSSGDATIQLPEVSSRDFVQRAWLASGQMLVLAGFGAAQSRNDQSGVVDATSWFFGGQRSVANTQESIVILITPYVTASENRL